ncbi:hypothetical protein D3C86_1261280 [compost metagenome]
MKDARLADSIDKAAADNRPPGDIADLGQGAGAAGARQDLLPDGLAIRGAQRHQFARGEGRDDGVAADRRAGGAHDARRLGDAAIGPVLTSRIDVESHQLVVDVDDIDALTGDRRCAVDRQINRRLPQFSPRGGVQRRHGAIAGGDKDLAAADGYAAAETAAGRAAAEADAQDARAAIMLIDLDVGFPQDRAGACVHRRHAGLAVQHVDLAAVRDDRGHDLTGAAGARADVAPPGDRELRRSDDMLDRVVGVAARLGPGGRRLGPRQEEVTAGQSRRRRQLLLELQNRDALPFGRLGDVFLLAAQAERQSVAHGAAGRDGHGQTAQQGDFQRSVHAGRPESVDYGRTAAGAASA